MINKLIFDNFMALSLSYMNICLIPRKEKPNKMSHFKRLRQGNLLYHFIFVLCTETLIREAGQDNRNACLTCHPPPPNITPFLCSRQHIPYKAESRECDKIIKAITNYRKTSGQCINYDKPSFLFGKHISRNVNFPVLKMFCQILLLRCEKRCKREILY